MPAQARLPRLKRRREFLLAASKGKRAARDGLVLQALAHRQPGAEPPLRLGFTVTKKVGNAVVRNRAKRRLREAARAVLATSPPAGWDLVLIGRDATPTRNFGLLVADLRAALERCGVRPRLPA